MRVVDYLERVFGRAENIGSIVKPLGYFLFALVLGTVLYGYWYLVSAGIPIYSGYPWEHPGEPTRYGNPLIPLLAALFLVVSLCATLVTSLWTAYTVVYFVVYHLSNKISDPKTIPLTYLVAIISLMVALCKGALDLVKALGFDRLADAGDLM